MGCSASPKSSFEEEHSAACLRPPQPEQDEEGGDGEYSADKRQCQSIYC